MNIKPKDLIQYLSIKECEELQPLIRKKIESDSYKKENRLRKKAKREMENYVNKPDRPNLEFNIPPAYDIVQSEYISKLKENEENILKWKSDLKEKGII